MRLKNIVDTVMRIMMSTKKTYSELITLPTYSERFEYLKLSGSVGEDTFGRDRYVNQIFYRSPEWRRVRRDVIVRDCGRDLACEGFDIHGPIIIHHIEPITLEDILERNPKIVDLENLITTIHPTHNALHYGRLPTISEPVVRTANDTCPWKR